VHGDGNVRPLLVVEPHRLQPVSPLDPPERAVVEAAAPPDTQSEGDAPRQLLDRAEGPLVLIARGQADEGRDEVVSEDDREVSSPERIATVDAHRGKLAELTLERLEDRDPRLPYSQ